MNIKRNKTQAPAPWLYLFGVLAWTWSFLGLVALVGGGLFTFPNVVLAAPGGLGLLIVAGILISLGHWDPALDENVWEFFRRALDPRTLPWRWVLFVLLLVLILAIGPVLLDATMMRETCLIEAGPVLTLLIGLFFGALEEPGWRGYAQEGLQRRMIVF